MSAPPPLSLPLPLSFLLSSSSLHLGVGFIMLLPLYKLETVLSTLHFPFFLAQTLYTLSYSPLFSRTAPSYTTFLSLCTQGVTIPSQRRYVQYYGHLIRNNLLYTPKTMLLKAMRFEGIPAVASGTCGKLSCVLMLSYSVTTSCAIYT